MLDVCRTAQHVAINRSFCCCPEMTETMDLSITGFVHPFTKEGRSNDWKMSNGNICILTGSNMAGKSTTLKAITIAVWLAHCGLPVPARSMICPVFDGIYTSINLPGLPARWQKSFYGRNSTNQRSSSKSDIR